MESSPDMNAAADAGQGMFRPFSVVLIANRGEIAIRIARAAKAKGLETVAVFSEADADAPFVRQADRAVLIGPGPASQSYLNIDRILEAAAIAGADAIHPGYGFLSENAGFARRVRAAGLNFIGPRADTIEAMGDKVLARNLALRAGLRCPPSFDDDGADEDTLVAAAERIGFPIMVKAVAGGGGRGIRKVSVRSELPTALSAVRTEASTAFGRAHLCLEKYIANGRHVEIQIAGDALGNVFHIGERDCSIQRRHQKLIEEAPSPAVDAKLRQAMAEAALELARSVNYVGVGTVEFMLDENGDFYFLEVNPRLQVEHPVTELVYGVDIVGLQFDIARGRPIEKTWSDSPQGAAIEARVLAEDPRHGSAPQTGKILAFVASDGEGVRVDHGLCAGTSVPLHYDSMIAKVVAHGRDREEARSRLMRALANTRIFGLRTNADYLRDLMQSEAFAAGSYGTEFLGAFEWQPRQEPSLRLVAACSLLSIGFANASGRRGATPSFDSFLAGGCTVDFMLDDVAHAASLSRIGNAFTVKWQALQVEASVFSIAQDHLRVRIGGLEEDVHFAFDGASIHLAFESRHAVCTPFRRSDRTALEVREVLHEEHATIRILAPMGAVVSDILAVEGTHVAKQACVVRLEAMKMVHDVMSPRAGIVRKILVAAGSHVSRNELMVELEVC